MDRIETALRKHWRVLLALLGASSSLDLLKNWVRGKIMDWVLSNLGKSGEWIFLDPWSILTVTTICVVIVMGLKVLVHSGKLITSTILDHQQKELRYHRASIRWQATFGSLAVIVVALMAYGLYRYQMRPSLPGVSVHSVLALHNQHPSRRQIVFEFGDAAHGRLDAYISADGTFTFSLLDANGELFDLLIPIGAGGVPLDRFVYLACEVGRDENITKMRVFVDGREVGYRYLPFWAAIDPLAGGGTIGNDASRLHGSAMTISVMAVYSRTLTRRETADTLTYFKNQYPWIGSALKP